MLDAEHRLTVHRQKRDVVSKGCLSLVTALVRLARPIGTRSVGPSASALAFGKFSEIISQ
jgi:hypothetical protein